MYQKILVAIACLTVICTSICTSVAAQESASFLSHIETGVAVAAGGGLTSDAGNAVSVPWSLRLAWVRGNSQWGLEAGTEFGGRRTVNGAHFREFGLPFSLIRRIGRGTGPRGTAGTYLGLGYSYTIIARKTNSIGVVLPGVVATVGQRIALGNYGVLRPELVALRDWGRLVDNLYYSGVMRLSARVGFSFYYPDLR